MAVYRMDDKELENLLAEGQHRVLYENSLSINLSPEIKQDTVKRRGKYNAKKKEVDGILFDSTGEAGRYVQLKFQASLGLITHDEKWLQVPFELLPQDGKQRPIIYRVDFLYRVGDILVAEDFKGLETPTFKMKAKMFRSQYKEYVLWVNKDKGAIWK